MPHWIFHYQIGPHREITEAVDINTNPGDDKTETETRVRIFIESYFPNASHLVEHLEFEHQVRGDGLYHVTLPWRYVNPNNTNTNTNNSTSNSNSQEGGRRRRTKRTRRQKKLNKRKRKTIRGRK